MKTTHNIGYALLLVLFSITLHSCFLVRKHKTITKSTTDSTAYSKIESSYTKKAEEAWNNYLNNQGSDSTSISLNKDSSSHVKLNADGSIEVVGYVGNVWKSFKMQTIKKDSGSKKSVDSTKYINTTYTIKETITLIRDKQVERKPDYWGVTLWGLGILALIALVWWVWRNWFRFPIPF